MPLVQCLLIVISDSHSLVTTFEKSDFRGQPQESSSLNIWGCHRPLTCHSCSHCHLLNNSHLRKNIYPSSSYPSHLLSNSSFQNFADGGGILGGWKDPVYWLVNESITGSSNYTVIYVLQPGYFCDYLETCTASLFLSNSCLSDLHAHYRTSLIAENPKPYCPQNIL